MMSQWDEAFLNDIFCITLRVKKTLITMRIELKSITFKAQ